jgi:hypothetical protein
LTTMNGLSLGRDGCVDHEDPECESRSEAMVETFSSPTTAQISVHAACRFGSSVLCLGGLLCESGSVEDEEDVSGLSMEPHL